MALKLRDPRDKRDAGILRRGLSLGPLGALLCLPVFFVFAAPSAHACSTCFGAQDSAQTQGMNFAILALLGILFCVLGLVGCFVGMLAFRARKAAGSAGASPYRGTGSTAGSPSPGAATPGGLEGATP